MSCGSYMRLWSVFPAPAVVKAAVSSEQPIRSQKRRTGRECMSRKRDRKNGAELQCVCMHGSMVMCVSFLQTARHTVSVSFCVRAMW